MACIFATNCVVSGRLGIGSTGYGFPPPSFRLFRWCSSKANKKAMPLGIAFVMMKLPDSLGFLGNLAGFPSSTVAATASGTGHR